MGSGIHGCRARANGPGDSRRTGQVILGERAGRFLANGPGDCGRTGRAILRKCVSWHRGRLVTWNLYMAVDGNLVVLKEMKQIQNILLTLARCYGILL